MKRAVCILLSVVMAVTMLIGCGSQSNKEGNDVENAVSQEEKREKVVVACWGNQMLDTYTEYLCDLFPQVEFEFVLATNSTDYYRFRQDHDDMPDILTVRRFALKDAVLLKEYLYDLSNTELANTYYGSYLDSYTYDDGTVNWLPTCAEVDGIIINKADGDNVDKAQMAAAQFRNALHLFPPTESGWSPKVLTYSGYYNIGVKEIWDMVDEYMAFTKKNGYFEYKRREQAKYWMYESINDTLRDTFYNNPAVSSMLNQTEQQVLGNEITPFIAAKRMMDLFLENISNTKLP